MFAWDSVQFDVADAQTAVEQREDVGDGVGEVGLRGPLELQCRRGGADER